MKCPVCSWETWHDEGENQEGFHQFICGRCGTIVFINQDFCRVVTEKAPPDIGMDGNPIYAKQGDDAWWSGEDSPDIGMDGKPIYPNSEGDDVS